MKSPYTLNAEQWTHIDEVGLFNATLISIINIINRWWAELCNSTLKCKLWTVPGSEICPVLSQIQSHFSFLQNKLIANMLFVCKLTNITRLYLNSRKFFRRIFARMDSLILTEFLNLQYLQKCLLYFILLAWQLLLICTVSWCVVHMSTSIVAFQTLTSFCLLYIMATALDLQVQFPDV